MTREITVTVKVKPNAKREEIKELSSNELEIAVKEPPQEGKANKRVIELVASYFNVPKSNVSIVRGEKSKSKILKVIKH